MYVNLSYSSIENIAEGLVDLALDYLKDVDYQNFKKLKEHEYGGDYAIENLLEEVSSYMAESFHGDIEGIVLEYFERNKFWQQDVEEAVDKALEEADVEAEDNKEDEDE
ncbi:MAG: hypothetical protein CMH52_14380 [Myxococcales bacterium]|nr:hypothetical protein [Myxococcales bacterium]